MVREKKKRTMLGRVSKNREVLCRPWPVQFILRLADGQINYS